MNRIKELRQKEKLTQEELASIIGVTKRTIIAWEKGERQIKQDKAKALADYFEVQVTYLLGFSNFRTHYEEDFFYTTGYPLNMSEEPTLDELGISEEEDKEARNRIEETYLRFITETDKLKALRSDTLVAIKFIESIRNNLKHGVIKPFSYAWEMDKISSQLLDLIDRIDQREEELTS